MTLRSRSMGGLMALAWALVGVLGGHLVTYGVLFPEAHVHDRVLADSGHGWTALLGPAALTAVAVAIALGLVRGTGHAHRRGVRFTTLLLLQAGLFASMELAERIASSGLTIDSLGHHLADHGLGAILVLGMLIQVITAWLGSAVSRIVAAVAERLRAAPPRRRMAHAHLVPANATLPAARSVRAHGSRGPPVLVATGFQTP